MNPQAIETVLAEILDEQKQVNSRLASFTDVVMQIHERKTSPGGDSSTDIIEHLKSIDIILQNLSSQAKIPAKEIALLKDSLDRCTVQLQQPVRQVVKHHISKIWIATAGLAITVMIMVYFLVATYDQLKEYKAGDIKYRHLKSIDYPNIQSLLLYTDSIYRIRPDSFIQKVELLEARKKFQQKLLHQASQKETEAADLRKKAKEK